MVSSKVRLGHSHCLLTFINFQVPSPKDPRPGRFVRHIDFNHFRTIGMRRSIEEGLNSRFVTGDRVQAVLRVCTSVFFPR